MKRSEAIQILDNERKAYIIKGCKLDKAIDVAIEALSERTGEWILVCDSEGEGDNLYCCSECGCEYGCQEYDKPNFCPDCGADMRNEVM